MTEQTDPPIFTLFFNSAVALCSVAISKSSSDLLISATPFHSLSQEVGPYQTPKRLKIGKAG
jgi:hypothetical protein